MERTPRGLGAVASSVHDSSDLLAPPLRIPPLRAPSLSVHRHGWTRPSCHCHLVGVQVGRWFTVLAVRVTRHPRLQPSAERPGSVPKAPRGARSEEGGAHSVPLGRAPRVFEARHTCTWRARPGPPHRGWGSDACRGRGAGWHCAGCEGPPCPPSLLCGPHRTLTPTGLGVRFAPLSGGTPYVSTDRAGKTRATRPSSKRDHHCELVARWSKRCHPRCPPASSPPTVSREKHSP